MSGPRLVGWRYAAVIGTLVGGICAAIYPIIIEPYQNPQKWQQIQKEARAGQDRSKMQPGDMKVWTDPFERK